MKNAALYFWILFILYFIFAHPAIIYYHSEFKSTSLAHVDPDVALLKLGLSLFLWSFILIFSLYLICKFTIIAGRRQKYILREGRRVKAGILSMSALSDAGGSVVKRALKVQFDNLSAEMITHEMFVKDDKPDENRFDPGKEIFLRIDEKFKYPPYLAVEGNAFKINPLYFIVWALFMAAVAYYFNFSYDLENQGHGWRFLSLSHPLISCAACLIFFPGLIYLFFRYVIFKKMNVGKKNLMLKLRGKRAIARLTDIQQTGTFINEQPELRFNVSFQDAQGTSRSVTLQRIVQLTSLSAFTEGEEYYVFYDPANPELVLLEEDLIS